MKLSTTSIRSPEPAWKVKMNLENGECVGGEELCASTITFSHQTHIALPISHSLHSPRSLCPSDLHSICLVPAVSQQLHMVGTPAAKWRRQPGLRTTVYLPRPPLPWVWTRSFCVQPSLRGAHCPGLASLFWLLFILFHRLCSSTMLTCCYLLT